MRIINIYIYYRYNEIEIIYSYNQSIRVLLVRELIVHAGLKLVNLSQFIRSHSFIGLLNKRWRFG